MTRLTHRLAEPLAALIVSLARRSRRTHLWTILRGSRSLRVIAATVSLASYTARTLANAAGGKGRPDTCVSSLGSPCTPALPAGGGPPLSRRRPGLARQPWMDARARSVGAQWQLASSAPGGKRLAICFACGAP